MLYRLSHAGAPARLSLKGGERDVWGPASLPRASSQGQPIVPRGPLSVSEPGKTVLGTLLRASQRGHFCFRLFQNHALLPGFSALLTLFCPWRLQPECSPPRVPFKPSAFHITRGGSPALSHLKQYVPITPPSNGGRSQWLTIHRQHVGQGECPHKLWS